MRVSGGDACLLRVDELSYSYPDAGSPALSEVSFELDDGGVLGVLGPVGAGKTTLCLCLAGLMPRVYGGRLVGSVEVPGRNPRRTPTAEYARDVGVVFEDYSAQLTQIRVLDEVAAPLQNRGVPADEYIADRVARACELVGLDDDLLDADPTLLPFGQRKLVTIAAAVVREPAVVVLDEPGTGLDAASLRTVEQAVTRLADTGVAVILVEHEVDLVGELTDTVTVMEAGAVALQGPTRTVFRWDNWERLLDLHIVPPRPARLGYALGVEAVRIDDLARAFAREEA